MNAQAFVDKLIALRSDEERAKVTRHYKGPGGENQCLGVRMGSIFALAKTFIDLPLDEIEKLLESEYYEIRMGGVSVMDFQARRKRTPSAAKKDLYELYIRRHDRINNWDLVDRAAPYVVGGYLCKKSRNPLYRLASSASVWERRTSIVSTYFFLRLGDLDDTFGIAAKLIQDESEFVSKAVGSWLREAGKKDENRLIEFLSTRAPKMQRAALRIATEKLDESAKKKLRGLS